MMGNDAIPSLDLVPAGSVDEALLSMLGADLESCAGMQWRIGEPMALPDEWRDPVSGLYRSILLMHALMDRNGAAKATDGPRWLLAITGAGLCAEGVGPVFGEAAVEGCCAVVGLAPLRWGSGADADVLRSRMLTEALHELGHLAGAEHCRRASCVMYPSLDIADTDRKSAAFCEDCRSRVQWLVKRKS